MKRICKNCKRSDRDYVLHFLKEGYCYCWNCYKHSEKRKEPKMKNFNEEHGL